MRDAIRQVGALVRMTRLTVALSIVGNAWVVVLWSRAEAQTAAAGGLPPGLLGPLWGPLTAASLAAFGLYAFGAVVNDVIDVRRDRVLGHEGPVALGHVGVATAVWLAVVTGALGVLGATWFGSSSVLLALLLQLGALGYNAAARFVPALGLLILGALHAGVMLIPNVRPVVVWPLWLVMTHAIAVAAAVHAVGGRAPRISRRAWIAVGIGWAAMSAAMLGSAWGTQEAPLRALLGRPVPITAMIGPGLLAAVFVAWAWRMVWQHGRGGRSAEKIARYGSLWMPLYGVALLAGAGHTGPATLVAGLVAVAGPGVAVLRELYGLITEPVAYRRT